MDTVTFLVCPQLQYGREYNKRFIDFGDAVRSRRRRVHGDIVDEGGIGNPSAM
jgi:hypothetical protein